MSTQITVREILDAGITQSNLADRLQCSQATVSAFLNGKRGKRLSYELGSRLLAIHQEVTKKVEPSNHESRAS